VCKFTGLARCTIFVRSPDLLVDDSDFYAGHGNLITTHCGTRCDRIVAFKTRHAVENQSGGARVRLLRGCSVSSLVLLPCTARQLPVC